MSQCIKYLQYTLKLQAPVIVTTLSGDPNSAATQPFIPGNSIRGALARLLLPSSSRSGSDDDFQELILGGNVRYLHAYPASGSTRALPTPISWRLDKGNEGDPAFDPASYTGRIDAETKLSHDQSG